MLRGLGSFVLFREWLSWQPCYRVKIILVKEEYTHSLYSDLDQPPGVFSSSLLLFLVLILPLTFRTLVIVTRGCMTVAIYRGLSVRGEA